MPRHLLSTALVLMLSATLCGGETPEPTPAVRRILDKATAEVAKNREACDKANRLSFDKARQALQDVATQCIADGKVDDAIAALQQIARLEAELLQPPGGPSRGVEADPGTLMGLDSARGRTLAFRVVGSDSRGWLWGSNPYTADSSLAKAVVHAGVLQSGESGVVRVTILPGRPCYEGSSKNGVSSASWGSFGLSYRIEGTAEGKDPR